MMKRDYRCESQFLDTDPEETDSPKGPLAATCEHATSPANEPCDDLLRQGDREELRQRIRLFLAGSHIPGLRQVRVDLDGDTVVLQGEVGTYYEKQMAAQFASRVAGVIRVVDFVEVGAYVPPRPRTLSDSARRRAP